MSTTFCCSYWYISIYSEKCFDYNTHTANWVPLTSNCDIHWVIFLIWVWNHSPTSVGGIYMSVLFLYFSPQSVSTVLSLYVIFYCGLPEFQFWPAILRWWITVFFKSTVISMLPLSYVLFCVSVIATYH